MDNKAYKKAADVAIDELHKERHKNKWHVYVLLLAIGIILLSYFSLKSLQNAHDQTQPMVNKLVDTKMDSRFRLHDFEHFLTHARVNKDGKICIADSDHASHRVNQDKLTKAYILLHREDLQCTN